ncbi:hypothetical protein ABLA30_05460 [Xenorhabdus nematophila]|uniref:hypothetical protein n=1 Tax=Xenorhabdus nematophila TaxID=628 RepID=UPI0032B86541
MNVVPVKNGNFPRETENVLLGYVGSRWRITPGDFHHQPWVIGLMISASKSAQMYRIACTPFQATGVLTSPLNADPYRQWIMGNS